MGAVILPGLTTHGLVLRPLFLLSLGAELMYWFTLLVVVLASPSSLRRTFYSTETGPAFRKRHNWTDQTNERRAKFTSKYDYSWWQPFEGEVKVWLIEGWEQWLEDQEPWFNSDFVDGLPQHLVPAGLTAWVRDNAGASQEVEAAQTLHRSSVFQVIKRAVTGTGQGPVYTV